MKSLNSPHFIIRSSGVSVLWSLTMKKITQPKEGRIARIPIGDVLVRRWHRRDRCGCRTNFPWWNRELLSFLPLAEDKLLLTTIADKIGVGSICIFHTLVAFFYYFQRVSDKVFSENLESNNNQYLWLCEHHKQFFRFYHLKVG